MLDRPNHPVGPALGDLEASLGAALATGGEVSRELCFELCAGLYRQGEHGRALAWLDRLGPAVAHDFGFANLRGVVLRNLGRIEEAITALRRAGDIEPDNIQWLINIGNAHLERADGPAAVAAFARAAEIAPEDGRVQHLLGGGHYFSGDPEQALVHFRRAPELAPDDPWSWIKLASLTDECGDTAGGLALLAEAIERLGAVEPLVRARMEILRRNGRTAEAADWARALLAEQGGQLWLHMQLARSLTFTDRDAANRSFAAALALDPDNPEVLGELADSLDRTRGPEEARAIAVAYKVALKRLAVGGNLRPHAKILRNVFLHNADHASIARLGSFEALGDYWAAKNDIAALHYALGQVETPDQRRRLVGWHRTWGRAVEAAAAKSPLTFPRIRRKRAKIRVGLMSSDLRNHPVAYFAAPLILGLDRTRFEVFCYSWNRTPADAVQTRLAKAADAFRLEPNLSDREAAQLIANDRPDILIELGGSTHMNKIKTMAWRPAPRQASWLGYPHSAGLETIDRIVTDPFITPADPALLVERPLELAHSWVAFERPGFGPMPAVAPEPPETATGVVTFGTMNNSYKYNPRTFAAWARVMREVPGSRFLFVRPESGAPTFRANVEAAFAAQGIGRDRLRFVAVRGAHLPHYNSIDICLDTLPQTGGTTTCESLFMGVPVVTLVGEAFFERLSHSNLNNAGLGDLCAHDVDGYVATAVRLAADIARRRELRRTLRARLKQHPLGRTDLFVADWADALTRWMEVSAR